LKSQSSRARKARFAPSADTHYLISMTDKPKRPRDANQLAKFITELATGEAADAEPKKAAQRAGGLKGGPARSASLTPEQRADIARTAASARWKKSD
jgi:hypothetical protein